MQMNANISGAVEDIASAQVRAARGLLGWSRDRLVEASGVPKRTIVRFEDEVTAPRKSTISAIRAALEAAGVEFIAENGGGIGVRLRKSE